uniref:Reverse transcriptase domain-containing protein n=1 Tax=Tanacetum cinerariifolium TaxID=118510 RepID=A0A6L2KGI3_TANCI|nr:reverse transcriptase domain-containing protein [Tanacetum cinerariifolium]
MDVPIVFPPIRARDLSEEAIMVEAEIEGYLVRQIHVDEGAFIEIIREIMKFIVICAPSSYNIILGFPGLKQLREIPSTIHGMMKFPTPWGVATLVSQTAVVLECRRAGKKQTMEPSEEKVKLHEGIGLTKEALVNPAHPDQLVTIDKNLSLEGATQLKNLLKKNKDIFAWEPSNMTRVPKRIIKHALNTYPSVTPVSQKRRVFSAEKSQVVTQEVAEWLKAEIVRPVKYPTWISNLVLVKKADGSWRICIDFKNINFVCPKDYYPLPEIDHKIDSVMGFPFKCFRDVYKGYHQIQMTEEDEEKTTFYTDQGTFCYTKIPFGLKNAGATYQRLIDEAFKSQIGRNVEAYVDDMVVKSKSEREMIVDIAETFDNLRRINMKLNPKTCSFEVEERKFLGYMVTSGRTLHDAEQNYAPLEKIALALLHTSRRLRRYFEAHPITVITDQPIKQILNKAEAFGRLAKYSVELGAYNITYEPRSAIKGQILANFINEVPVGRESMGMDVLGPFPEALRKVKFVIVVVDYFSKWTEAKSLAKTTGKEHGETPYSLTFGSEAIILAETGMPTHRTMTIKDGTLNEEEIRLNLDLLQERKEATAIREALYKMKMEQYYNKRVRPTAFKVGEYVYRRNEASRVENLDLGILLEFFLLACDLGS